MTSIGIYGDSYADNTHSKFDTFRKENAWPDLLEKLTGYKVYNYALSGTNRHYTYKKLEKTLGDHEYNIIFHTYYYRKFYVDPIMEDSAWWIPDIGYECPNPEFEELITDYYKYFYNFEANKIAHLGFNLKIQELINNRNLDKNKIVHVFIDTEEDNAFPLNLDNRCIVGFHDYEYNEIVRLKGTPKYNHFIGKDIRACHLSLVNNARVADMFNSIIKGNTEPVDLNKVFLHGETKEVQDSLDFLIEKYGN